MRSRTTTGAPRLRPSPSAALFSARAISITPKELTSARYSPGRVSAVGAQQREGVIAGVHQRQAEALDERAVDVGDEVAEVIDGDDDAGDAARLDAQAHRPTTAPAYSTFSPRSSGVQRPAASSARHRRDDVATVEGGARPVDAEPCELGGAETHDERVADARLTTRREQPVVGSDEAVPAALTTRCCARCPRPGRRPRRAPCRRENTRTRAPARTRPRPASAPRSRA